MPSLTARLLGPGIFIAWFQRSSVLNSAVEVVKQKQRHYDLCLWSCPLNPVYKIGPDLPGFSSVGPPAG
jgi:hypothetical protein